MQLLFGMRLISSVVKVSFNVCSFWWDGCCLCQVWCPSSAPWYPAEAVAENPLGLQDQKLAVDLFSFQWKGIKGFFSFLKHWHFEHIPSASYNAAVVPWVGVWDSCWAAAGAGLGARGCSVPQQGRCHCQPCALGAEWRPEKHQWREKAKEQNQQKIKEKKNFFGPVKILVKICLLDKSLALLFSSVLLLGLHFLLLCLLSELFALFVT